MGGIVTTGSHHTDGRWLVGVVRGEDEGAPVLTSFVRGVFGASDDVMPSVGGVVNIGCEKGGEQGAGRRAEAEAEAEGEGG